MYKYAKVLIIIAMAITVTFMLILLVWAIQTATAAASFMPAQVFRFLCAANITQFPVTTQYAVTETEAYVHFEGNNNIIEFVAPYSFYSQGVAYYYHPFESAPQPDDYVLMDDSVIRVVSDGSTVTTFADAGTVFSIDCRKHVWLPPMFQEWRSR